MHSFAAQSSSSSPVFEAWSDAQDRGAAGGGEVSDGIICSHELPDVMLSFSPTFQCYEPRGVCRQISLPLQGKMQIAGCPLMIVHTLAILL